MPNDPLSDLHRILAQEKTALLAGDYRSLEELQTKKQRALAALEALPPPQDALRVLKQSMDTNLALTRAAIRGIQTARDRLAELHKVRSGLTTYQKDGTLADQQTPSRTVEKRA